MRLTEGLNTVAWPTTTLALVTAVVPHGRLGTFCQAAFIAAYFNLAGGSSGHMYYFEWLAET